MPCVDEGAAERLSRDKALALLRRRGLLGEERIDLLLSWRRPGSPPVRRGGPRGLQARWAELSRRACEVEPVVCPRGGEMRAVA